MPSCDGAADVVEWATDDGSFGFHGNVVQLLLSMAGPGAFTDGPRHRADPDDEGRRGGDPELGPEVVRFASTRS